MNTEDRLSANTPDFSAAHSTQGLREPQRSYPCTIVGLFKETHIAHQIVDDLAHRGIAGDQVLLLTRKGRLGAHALRRKRTRLTSGAIIGLFAGVPFALPVALASLRLGLPDWFTLTDSLPLADYAGAAIVAASVCLTSAVVGGGVGAHLGEPPSPLNGESEGAHPQRNEGGLHILVMVEVNSPLQLKEALAVVERQGGRSIAVYDENSGSESPRVSG